MSINVKKTVVMAQGYTYKPFRCSFTYLGSTVLSNPLLDVDIGTCIGKAATIFGKVNKNVGENPKART